MKLRALLFLVACCSASAAFAQKTVLISVPCNHLASTDCDRYTYVFHALGSYLFGEGHIVVDDLTGTGCERQPGQTYNSNKACLDAFFHQKRGDVHKPALPKDTAAAVQFLIDPSRREDGSIWGTWWVLPADGGGTSSTFVLRPTDRHGAPWVLVDATGLPEALNLYGLTDDVKRRGGFQTSGSTKIFAHLAVPLP